MRRQRPLHVLALMPSLMGGGAERQMLLLLDHLPREDFRLTLCVIERSGELLGHLPVDVPVLSLEKRSPRDVGALVIRLARILRRTRPDVVLAKVDYANVLAALAQAASGISVPLILGEESVPSSAAELMSMRRTRLSLLRWAYSRAAIVTAPSPGVAADLRHRVRVRERPISVIPNMIDVAQLVRQAEAEPDVAVPKGARLLVAAGRMQPAKGQADLLAAVELLIQRRPCHLLLLGEGADRPRLESIARERRISEHVTFLGFVPNPGSFMARADVFVSPSHFESFGNVLIEAMAVGTPVVSTLVREGPRWLIEDGHTGLFAAPRNPQDLAKKIEIVLADSSRAEELVRAGRRFAAEFDVPRILPRYAEALQAAGEMSADRRGGRCRRRGRVKPVGQP